MIRVQRFLLLSICCLSIGSALYAMNLLSPYDTLLRPTYENGDRYHVNIFLEGGTGPKSFNSFGTANNSLQIWQADVDGLAMLQGLNVNGKPGQLFMRLDANDDGTRGHLCVNGDLQLIADGAVDARFFFLNNWFFSVHMPMYSMELNNVQFIDKTENITDSDARVKSLLTNNFAANVFELGNCLEICPWKRTGLGDTTLLVNWFANFPQDKILLKNVRANWRAGFTVPTGKRSDEDKLFAISYGYNGSFAIPFGFGLDLTYVPFFRIGFDVQLTQIFGSTRDWRIKTNINQNELVLLTKAVAYKDYGLTQRFNLYAQLYDIVKGFSFLLGYQFYKHGTDHLSLCTNQYSETIANSALSLKDYTLHQIILNFTYEFIARDYEDGLIRPYFSLFSRLPFNGKRVTAQRTVGCVIGITF